MSSDHSSAIKASTTDELRMRNHRANMERKNEIERRDLEERHNDDLSRLIDNHAFQIDNLRQAYDVQISQEAEALEDRLHQVRLNNEQRTAAEKQAGEEQLKKVKTSYEQRIDEYKKNGEAQINKVRQELQASTNNLQEQARKSNRRQKEVSGS